jgi:hypothetical protein
MFFELLLMLRADKKRSRQKKRTELGENKFSAEYIIPLFEKKSSAFSVPKPD